MEPKVNLGDFIWITDNALAKLKYEADLERAFDRHNAADWGEVFAEEKSHNDQALLHGGCMRSVHTDRNGVTFWITSGTSKWSVTTVLVPEDFISQCHPLQTKGVVMSAKFSLGQLLSTPNAIIGVDPHDVVLAMGRHAKGDWGEVNDEDKRCNDQAVKDGGRLLSAYTDRNGVKFWIITEADRSATTVHLPDDY